MQDSLSPPLTNATFRSPQHSTHYWEAGPPGGPLMIWLHGWPGVGLLWRAQLEAFASEGWHCVAPDMRGYGGSTVPIDFDAYTLEQIVGDMVELHEYLGSQPAIWVGHDWGSPVVGALAAHFPQRTRGIVLISVPYFPSGFALPSLVPLIDRQLYPAEQFPDGQWDYYRFYQTHFDQAAGDLEADIRATLASIYRPGNPASAGKISPSAMITANGGRYGSARRAPPTQPDSTLWPPADFERLVQAFHTTGFRPCNSWYLNDSANIAYSHGAPNATPLRMPVLYVNGEWDPICDIKRGQLGEPMRSACTDLLVSNLPAGHWLPLECKTELVESIRSWIESKRLQQVTR